MASVAIAAGKQKPTRLGQVLDKNRWLRWAMLIGSVVAAVVLSIVADANGAEDHLLGIDTDVYLAVVGLFVAALALERVTELVIDNYRLSVLLCTGRCNWNLLCQ